MKITNKALIAVLALSSLSGLASCEFGKDDPIKFVIESTGDRFILDSNENNIVFSLAEDSYLGKPTYIKNEEGEKVEVPKVVTYTIVGENEAEATIENNKLTATKYGTVKVQGKCGDLVSDNTIDITICYSDLSIAKNLQAILYDNNEGVVLGKTYETGITPNIVDDIVIEGSGTLEGKANDLIKINEQGQIEVIGIGYGKIKITNKATSEVLYDNHYNTFASILCRRIREDLIAKGEIPSMAGIVTADKLSLIKEISLAGELINDPEASIGVKYLQNLEVLDLSDNKLTDLEFVSPLKKLKNINLSNNRITNLDSVITNEDLEVVNLSYNGIEDISKLQYLHNIKKLDLSNNNIKSINSLSSSYSLESLFISNNGLENYKECLSNLEYLQELGVGHCNIPFTDIISLKYLSNLTYLDIAGTAPSVQTIAGLSKLETLILQDCKLNETDIKPLNSLLNLKTLDISNNNITPEDYNNAFEYSNLTGLKTLKFGGNAFTQMPNLSRFAGLETLDLTSSYNLLDLTSLKGLNIKELVLDKCNSLDVSDNAVSYKEAIEAMPNLEKLSVQEGFNYINPTLYSYLNTKVQNGELTLRFLDDKYVDYTSVHNFSRSIFFDMESFLEAMNLVEDTYEVNAIGESQHIILSLVNDGSDLATSSVTLNINKTLFQLDIYGNHNKSYKVNFNIADRKQSSFTLALSNFKNSPGSGGSIVAAADSRLILKAINGANELYGNRGSAVISCHDLEIKCEGNATMYIKGSKGKDGAAGSNNSADSSNDSNKKGKAGETGTTAVKCNSIKLLSKGTTIVGGNGGNGGKGGNGTYEDLFDFGSNGGNGGAGGKGGNAVEYKTTYSNRYSCIVEGGTGGTGGKGGSKAERLGTFYDGSKGSDGAAGGSFVKVS